jgi:hypothetical protein
VRIAKRGTYTAKFTAELGPGQVITKTKKFLVK